MKTRPLVTNERFVRSWKRSRCISDMISHTGLTKNYIYIRARRLRKMGVILPYFTQPEKVVNVQRLNRIWREG